MREQERWRAVRATNRRKAGSDRAKGLRTVSKTNTLIESTLIESSLFLNILQLPLPLSLDMPSNFTGVNRQLRYTSSSLYTCFLKGQHPLRTTDFSNRSHSVRLSSSACSTFRLPSRSTLTGMNPNVHRSFALPVRPASEKAEGAF